MRLQLQTSVTMHCISNGGRKKRDFKRGISSVFHQTQSFTFVDLKTAGKKAWLTF